MRGDFAYLQEDLLAGRITRRQLIARGIALGLSSSAIAGLLAACGTTAAQPTTNTAKPRQGGTLRVGLSAGHRPTHWTPTRA